MWFSFSDFFFIQVFSSFCAANDDDNVVDDDVTVDNDDDVHVCQNFQSLSLAFKTQILGQ